MSQEHSHTGPRGTIYHIHIDDTPPDGPLAQNETCPTEDEMEYEETIATLQSQNRDLLAALEKVTTLLEHWILPGNKVLGGAMRVVAKGHAEQARAAIAAVEGETA